MRRSLVQLVAGGGQVRISGGFTHSVVFTAFKAVLNLVTCTRLVQAVYAGLYSGFAGIFNLLFVDFYPQSTGLITITTTFK